MLNKMNHAEFFPNDETRTAKAGVFNVIANVISLLTSVLFIPVISRILTATEMGNAALFNSVREIIIAILTLSLAQSIPLAMLDYKESKPAFMSSVFLFAGMCITVVFGATFFLRGKMEFLFFGSDFLYVWFFVPIFCQLALDIIINYANFHNIYIISSLFALLASPVTFIMSVVLIQNLEIAKYISRILALDSFIFIAGIPAIAVILIRGRFKMNREQVRYGVRITLPLIPYLLSVLLLNRSNIIIISLFQGSDKAGIYVMGFTLANIIYVVMMQAMKNWSPWVYRKLSQGETGLVRGASTHFTLFIFLACAGLMGVAPELIRLFTAAEYHECAAFVSILIAGMFFRFLNQLFFDVSYYHKRNTFTAIASITAPLLNILAGVIFIQAYGYIACVYVSALCNFLLALACLMYSHHIDKRKIYDMRSILVCAAAIIVLCGVYEISLNLPLLRYAVLAATVLAIIYFDRAFLSGLKAAALTRIRALLAR